MIINEITKVEVCSLGTSVPAVTTLIMLPTPPKGHTACNETSGKNGNRTAPDSEVIWFIVKTPVSVKKNICTTYLNHLFYFSYA